MVTNKFLVYAYYRKDGTFYYIGKGTNRRPYQKRKKGINPPKDKERVIIIHSNLDEETAFLYERLLIQFYGRKDKGEGLLLNRTDGGEGVSGWNPSQEWKDNKRNSMLGENNPFWNNKHSEEIKQKLSEGAKGRYFGEKNFFFGKKFLGEDNPMFGKKREDLSERNSQNPPAKGTKWFNDGEIDKRFLPSEVPPGFVPGRLRVSRGHKRPDLSERNKNRTSNPNKTTTVE
jgi:hypothetical protein